MLFEDSLLVACLLYSRVMFSKTSEILKYLTDKNTYIIITLELKHFQWRLSGG